MTGEPVTAPVLDTVEATIRHRIAELLGGWRGALETAIPTVAFVGVWAATQDVRAAVIASGAGVALLVLIRLGQRQTVRYALSSVLATALAAFFALRSGRAEDAFLPGILTNVGMAIGALVSMAARWPVVGFMVAAGDPEALEDPGVYARWREHPGMVAVCQRLTAVLVVLFTVRVAVMIPLYLDSQVTWLGVAKIALSWPAYLLAIMVMGLMLVRGRTPMDDPRSVVSG